jgi:hypothetical protein
VLVHKVLVFQFAHRPALQVHWAELLKPVSILMYILPAEEEGFKPEFWAARGEQGGMKRAGSRGRAVRWHAGRRIPRSTNPSSAEAGRTSCSRCHLVNVGNFD